ncbi:SDR family NAD(P)-dependent oxidoreductase [Glacieibacterium megasporae]|uniref:SDR family NAD(P)-dependent oxidoreductase n=1 Tax=Glacieibacterium megasporae TaxID=2835787 RepID=UPI001C1DE46D|nr:SDR family NAD(P)-dependent oxidoreductase [Polymorphobacter megasporae]UAJ12604.1 SDR family NAD(P)-dependent oxidoreductase [Polymorphobacter megasporae]
MTRPTALITGASAGIGAEFARQLASRGHDLVLVARREDWLRDVAAGLATDCEILVADLETDDGVTRVEARIADGPPLALIINNAGFAARGRVATLDAERLATMLRLNVIALSRLSHAAMQRMTADGTGAIINVGSGTALIQIPGNAGYGASKSYVMAFTRHMQAEAAGTGVAVQLLIPGVIATDFHSIAATSLDRYPPEMVMQTRDLVAASLTALDRGEAVCIPSLGEVRLWHEWKTAEAALATNVSRRKPADRYRFKRNA